MRIPAAWISVAAATLSCASCLGGAPSLKQRQDPFYIGGSAELTTSTRGNSSVFTSALSAQGEYAWDSGIAVQGIIPSVIAQGGTSSTGPGVPRLGGFLDQRAEVDGLFRAYGDTYDFLAFQFGVGFPWQTSTVQQHSGNAGWLLPIAALGRIDWGWGALEPELTDSPSFPASWYTGTTRDTEDTTNVVSVTVNAYFYAWKWVVPLVGYEEIFPTSTTYSFEPGFVDGYFASIIQHASRTREFWVGSEFGPAHVPVLVTLQAEYVPISSLSPDTVYGGEAVIRWLF